MSQNSGKPNSSDNNGVSNGAISNNNGSNSASTVSGSGSGGGSVRLPSNTCMQHASKLAIADDRPIMLDYWMLSLEKKVIIGVKENGEKLLVKSEDEYTSPIGKIFKIESEYIILTENSIYIVSSDIQSNRIN
jgi:hypothetical protein